VPVGEEALFARWQGLANDPNRTSERRDRKLASEQLLDVKTTRLGWPKIP
jgi:hypothetical protein